jgi:pimeloyl-ACP methyl ester carboxylesterase
MYRSIFALAALLAACDAAAPPPELETATEGLAIAITRDQIVGDVYHYGFVLRLGDAPNAQIHLHRVVRERAPWRPRATTGAIMLLHGDFATFATNFAPVLGTPPSTATGMATYLAQRGIDVWGFDRRWTQAPADGADLSDFDAMGIPQELDDIGKALTFARAIRLVTDGSLDRMTLIGFSRGGQLAYFYASTEAARPAWQRHVKGLVPLDVYASLSPADEDLRQIFCQSAFFEYADLGAGIVDTPNGFQIEAGSLALSAPNDPTPFQGFFPGLTNREVMLLFVGQTYFFFPASPFYHLASPVLDGDVVTALRESPENVVSTWLAGAAPHQSLREAADTDALVCGDAPLPADVPLSRIRVPLFYLGAAGAYGDHGLFSTTQVSSTDVETLVVRRFGPEREAEDFGHGDLLFATDAPQLAWQPLLSWLRRH